MSKTSDYLLWGRATAGEPGGVLLSLLMAAGAAALALPGGIVLACVACRYPGVVRSALFAWAELIRGIPPDLRNILDVVSAAADNRQGSPRRDDRHAGAGLGLPRLR